LSQCGAHASHPERQRAADDRRRRRSRRGTARRRALVIRALLAPPLCWSCRSRAPGGGALCRACRRGLAFLPREPVAIAGVLVWAPLAYEGAARDLVRALKFRGALSLAGEMAALMVASAPPALLRGTLVPVPLHAVRLRRRGFNQAGVLAEAIAARTGLETSDCLRRRGLGPRQVGRGRAARLSGPAASIEAPARAPEVALLVDDVVTTGATLAACAAALREAGARDVAGLAFARTPGR
jgi:predicted amidophosphoribosyltransferase